MGFLSWKILVSTFYRPKCKNMEIWIRFTPEFADLYCCISKRGYVCILKQLVSLRMSLRVINLFSEGMNVHKIPITERSSRELSRIQLRHIWAVLWSLYYGRVDVLSDMDGNFQCVSYSSYWRCDQCPTTLNWYSAFFSSNNVISTLPKHWDSIVGWFIVGL